MQILVYDKIDYPIRAAGSGTYDAAVVSVDPILNLWPYQFVVQVDSITGGDPLPTIDAANSNIVGSHSKTLASNNGQVFQTGTATINGSGAALFLANISPAPPLANVVEVPVKLRSTDSTTGAARVRIWVVGIPNQGYSASPSN